MRFANHTFFFLLLFAFPLIGGSLIFSCRPNIPSPVPSAGDADFTKFVALGGSLMAGYQDGSLYADGQKYSIPALLAKQFELVGGGYFNQPMMPDNEGLGLNPKPWELKYQHASKLRYKTDCEGITALKPVKEIFYASNPAPYDQHLSGSFQNMSVPFALISQYNDAWLGVSNSTNIFYHRFAAVPGTSTVLSDAKALSPTFVALWVGVEDVYEYARNGGIQQPILSSASFGLYLDSILSSLNAQGVIANIPDLTSFPFYTLVPWNGLELTQSKADSLNNLTGNLFNFQEGKNGFVIEFPEGSATYRKLVQGEYILLTVPLDSVKCNFLGVFTELPDRYVLDTAEVRIIRDAIAQYNSVIAAKAQQYNLALADMNAFFKNMVGGIKWDGVDFNAEFVSGGFYSLDGFHPNQKGYALIANELIKTINAKYNSTLPTVNCFECSGIKFP